MEAQVSLSPPMPYPHRKLCQDKAIADYNKGDITYYVQSLQKGVQVNQVTSTSLGDNGAAAAGAQYADS